VKSARAKTVRPTAPSHSWFAAILGGLLGLSLVKFGNPVILDPHVHRPETLLEWVYQAWPFAWALALVGLVLLLAPLVIITKGQNGSSFDPALRKIPPFLCLLPLFWYVWQWIAAVDTVEPSLTWITLAHFTACVALFYIGWFCLSAVGNLTPFFWGLLGGFALVLMAGFDQRFGGLEATRQMLYEAADLDRYPPELIRRIASERIFGTLFYPNALAGVILLLAPLLIWFVAQRTANRSNIVRGTAVGLLGYGSVACLFWSQSKAGWLVAALLVFIALLQVPASRRIRWSCATAIVLVALVVFAVRFSDYFAHGAASASARVDYWEAAWQTIKDHPINGTGPGTFQIPYATLKRPESEMARLTHNDYLQQGSDGGLASMVMYTLFVFGSIVVLYRRVRPDSLRFAVWLGLVGWALHSFVEFGLYIPAIAWPAFTLLGWLWAVSLPSSAARQGEVIEQPIA
jgi:hypothetical protein